MRFRVRQRNPLFFVVIVSLLLENIISDMPGNALNLVRLSQQPSRSKAHGEEKPKIEVSKALFGVDFFIYFIRGGKDRDPGRGGLGGSGVLFLDPVWTHRPSNILPLGNARAPGATWSRWGIHPPIQDNDGFGGFGGPQGVENPRYIQRKRK